MKHAHAGLPDHWDVQFDDGAEYIRVDQNGDEIQTLLSELTVSRNGSQSAKAVKEWALLANGSAGRWSIDIDESHDGAAWNMQIDGPLVYLGFALPDLQTVAKIYGYLLAGLQTDQANGQRSSKGITMGKVGSMTVRIIHDDEFATRCANGSSDEGCRKQLCGGILDFIDFRFGHTT